MSSQELDNNTINNSEDTINNIESDISSTMIFGDDNDNFKNFIVGIISSFIAIFLWGILGTTLIFWFKIAHNLTENVEICNGKNQKVKSIEPLLDYYFPYIIEEPPYSDSQCNDYNVNINKCFNDRTTKKRINATFPFNMLPNIVDVDNDLQRSSGITALLFFMLKIFLGGFLKIFSTYKGLFNKMFNKTGNSGFDSIFSIILMIFAKPIIFLLIFIQYWVSILNPTWYVIKQFFVKWTYHMQNNMKVKNIDGSYEKDYSIIFFVLTSFIFEKSKIIKHLYDMTKQPSWSTVFWFLLALAIIIVLMPITLSIDLSIFIFLCVISLFVAGPIFGISIFLSIFNSFALVFNLITGAMRDSCFIDVFKKHINILLFFFGASVVAISSYTLDKTITSYIAISFVIYIIYTLIKKLF